MKRKKKPAKGTKAKSKGMKPSDGSGFLKIGTMRVFAKSGVPHQKAGGIARGAIPVSRFAAGIRRRPSPRGR